MKVFFSVYVSLTALLFIGVSATTSLAQTSANAFAVNSSNQLLRFNTSTPGTVTNLGAISGLQAGESVVGIDVRPATGELYAVGSTSRLYTINKTTASATLVASLSTPLSGVAFGVDFNPTVDRLRIVSDSGQNLRANPATGVVMTDSTLNGPTSNVAAAAYTNSFNGATTTSLFDISTATDTLYLQGGLNGSPSPNGGTLTAVGPLNAGDVTNVIGFDTLSADGTAFAAMTIGSATSLYTINLSTGAATLIGAIGGAPGSPTISGFAIDIGFATNSLVFGLTTSNNLVRFNSVRPNTILGSVAFTGLQPGENIVGIDFRPATGQLYGLGSTSRLYIIDTVTGAATQVGSGTFTIPLAGNSFGVDFNPTVDRLRVISDTGQNIRINPITGAVITPADTNLNGAASGADAAAYTNNFSGATVTTLYDISSATDTLYGQGGPNGNPSPNLGVLTTIGPLGANVTAINGFDIPSSRNVALAALQVGSSTSSTLYTVDLNTGSASVIGPVGGGVALRGIAIGRNTASGAATSTADFDGDGRTDYSVFRLTNNTWFVNRSSNNSFFAATFGTSSTDILTPGDFDGDGRTDIAIWRTTNGTFFVLRSSDGGVTTFQWGILGDEPVPRDYDGDAKTDFAIVRNQGGQLVWYILNSSNGSIRIEAFGLANDFVAPGDYDGDGRFDLAVHRGVPGAPANFFVQASTAGSSVTPWGLGGDLVVPGDYDGDGKTDFAVVRPGTPYTWFVLRSSDLSLYADNFGTKPHFTTQGDYDGDGKTDFSTWDPLTGNFYVLRTATPGATSTFNFGMNGDYPVANYDTH